LTITLGALAWLVPTATRADDGGDETVIVDPELQEGDLSTRSEATCAECNPAEVSFEYRNRLAVDVAFDAVREDIIDDTQIVNFGIDYKSTEATRYALALRVRHNVASRRGNGAGDELMRYALDVIPVSAYLDQTLGDGLTARVGYQVTPLGRMDVFSATNMLAVYDLRSGPVTMPGGADVGQLALRVDYSAGYSWAFQAYLVPFFQPHIADLVGSDHALLAVGDEELVRNPNQFLIDAENNPGRSSLVNLSSDAGQELGPPADILHPQGAVRLTTRGSAGEAALTLGTALEHLPAIEFSQPFFEYMQRPTPLDAQTAFGTAPIELKYGRYYLASVDAATDVGPFQIGVEAAYMKDRTLLAAVTDRAPKAEQSDAVHGALSAEYIEEDAWIVSTEGFFAYALEEPRARASDPAPRAWYGLTPDRTLQGVAGMVRYMNDPFSVELAGVWFTGKTVVVAPRIEWQATDPIALEPHLAFVDGEPVPALGSPEVAVGGVYAETDLVFVGLRYKPE
jgi:hypothetical protein